MPVTALLLTLQKLSRADKLQVMHFLISELAKEENETPREDEELYRGWSPFNFYETAHKLAKLLE